MDEEDRKEKILNMYGIDEKDYKTKEQKEILDEFKKNPIKFCEEMLKIELTDFQKKMLLGIITYEDKLTEQNEKKLAEQNNTLVSEKKKRKNNSLKVIYDDLPIPRWRL